MNSEFQFEWGEQDFPGETTSLRKFGPLRVWHRASKGDLWLAWMEVGEQGPEPETPHHFDDKWVRYAFRGNPRKIRFLPVFPDRPVVMQPEAPFFLTPKSEARVYVNIPLWVRVELADNQTTLLREIPSLVLSNTWQGSFFEGDLAYWLSTRARREVEPPMQLPHTAVCPIQIHNRSEEELKVEKICLRVGWLSIFEKEGVFFGDACHVEYRGTDDTSQVEAKGRAPREASGAKLITRRRTPARRGLASTFSQLKSLPGLGIFTS
ncbi:MAG TPA: DUF432 domain-containing protein [Acidobacteriota bacterium]|nr:DUF432 domain-containing protein [Acidobacteriota bacterium]